MNKLNIAVVGGSGFIGTRLCQRLSQREDVDFVIIDKEKSEQFENKCVICDVRDREGLISALRGIDVVVNLAAEHKDNVSPVSLYYDVNVGGAENICYAAKVNGIKRHIFTSTVAVYGFVDKETDESGEINPFNDYGKSKWQAEEVYQSYKAELVQLSVVRPTVVFGEGNRGNVYNLFRQICSGRFIMIGTGRNKKSMAYVENVARFLEFLIDKNEGVHVFNYADKPDFDMNTLVEVINQCLDKGKVSIKIPYFVGVSCGYVLDIISWFTGKKSPISSIRIKKFCKQTSFFSTNIKKENFEPAVALEKAVKNTISKEFLG